MLEGAEASDRYAVSMERSRRQQLTDLTPNPGSALTEVGVGALRGYRFVVTDGLHCRFERGGSGLQLGGESGQVGDGLLIGHALDEAAGAGRHFPQAGGGLSTGRARISATRHRSLHAIAAPG